MNKIIPSTQLKVISVSRLCHTTCWRYYFWRWIRNLEPKKLNLNLWYGSVLGAGFEQMLLDGKYNSRKIAKTLKNTSKETMEDHIVDRDDIEEMQIQMRLITVILEGAAKQSFFKDMKMKAHQVKVSYEVMPDIHFCGVLDGEGTYKKKASTFEIKTASRVTSDTLAALEYDKQIYGYPIGLEKTKKNYPKKCCYIIFRKTQKRVKKNQTVDGFIEEIRQDTIKQPEFYYIVHPVTLGWNGIERVKKDIYQGTKILKLVYDSMSKKELLSPESWPKNEKQCLSYGACPYINLCRYEHMWKTYARFFKARKLFWELEKEELRNVKIQK